MRRAKPVLDFWALVRYKDSIYLLYVHWHDSTEKRENDGVVAFKLSDIVFYRLDFSLVELSQVVITNEYLKFRLSGCCCLLMGTEKGASLSERCTSGRAKTSIMMRVRFCYVFTWLFAKLVTMKWAKAWWVTGFSCPRGVMVYLLTWKKGLNEHSE